MEKLFKRSALSAAVIGFVAGMSMATAPVAHAEGFFEDSTINGAVNFWMRDRTRGNYDPVTGSDTDKETNLDHGSIYTNLGFSSGYASGVVGLDLNVYATFDMWQNGGADHEMNFWDVNNPFDKNASSNSCSDVWTDCNSNGVSYQTVAAKIKLGENAKARLGYFQPSVPTAMGVNWSYAAGTYLGGELGFSVGDLELGAVYATRYKAPWFKDTYELRTTKNEDAGDAYSLGARYTFGNGLLLDVAYAGLTDGDRKNAHIKLKQTLDNGWYLSPQLYVIDDDEQYDDTAFHLAFLSAKTFGQYTVRAEATYTIADSTDISNSMGNFAYRLTSQYGGSNGAYDIWWNNRSDFNHDGEFAVFGSVNRDFSDLGAPGFSAGFSAAAGMASSDVDGLDDLFEYSGSVFANYAIQNGALKGANIGFYYTEYVNDTDTPNWTGWTNLFQDESDIKVTLTLPFTIK